MKIRSYLLLMCLVVQAFNVSAQNESVTVEAENGVLGSDFTVASDDGIQYITIQTNGTAQNPEDSNRVVTYDVTFPNPGTYDLYARVKVGPGNADDDSFFYGNGFGEKTIDSDDDWIRANNLYTCGFNVSGDLVTGGGSLQSGVWKWINLSEFTQDEPPVSFIVDEDSLTQTFQIGAREDGLEIDKFVFGLAGLYFTVSILDNGQPGLTYPPGTVLPIAYGQDKFIGNVYSASQWTGFTTYWNQVTPENAGKWGSVEKTRDNMSWSTLDAAYNAAKDNNMPFKLHTLIWGNQQPSWIENLNSAVQYTEIKQWFSAVAGRYPDIDFVEVVNEPLHDPPDQAGNGGGNYIEALGGTGETGWDWVVKAFKLGRQYFPNSKLIINDYNIINNNSSTQTYKQLIELLQKDSLVDQIGVQAHAFSLNTSSSTITGSLNSLASTGLPIYVTELDIDGPTDEKQLEDYQRIFPLFWNHPSVKGITLWGFRPGMWRTDEKAYLVNPDGMERPALIWLRAYVNGTFVSTESISITAENDAATIDIDDGTIQLTAVVTPENVTLPGIEWSVIEENIASIDQEGLLTALKNGTVNVVAKAKDGSGKKTYYRITITNQIVAGVDEIKLSDNKNISIYPNPVSKGSFTIKGTEAIENLKILGIEGRIVKELRLNKQPEIKINMKADPGIYFIRMETGEKIYTGKIIYK